MRMMRAVATACALGLGSHGVLAAQSFHGGVSTGAGEAPWDLLMQCRDGTRHGATSAGATVHVGLRLARWVAVETRAGTVRSMSEERVCPEYATRPGIPRLHWPDQPSPTMLTETGSHTWTAPDFRSRNLVKTDVRVRATAGTEPALTIAAGGGWLVSHGVPFTSIAAGVRSGRRMRWGVEVERQDYRLPYANATIIWSDYQITSAEYFGSSDWQAEWSVRLVVEVVPGR